MNVLIGVTGSVAAYKSVLLVRCFQKNGDTVKVILSSNALKFISALTYQSLIGADNVYVDLFDYTKHPMEHISLAKWAEAIVIAPASAHCISKTALALGDDLLSNMLLAKPPETSLWLAPSMNTQMWQNPFLQRQMQALAGYVRWLTPEAGFLACGDYGAGRMAEPDAIFARMMAEKERDVSYQGLSVLMTLGATMEPIDPIRYIANHSSGKMGWALAQAFLKRGARVTLIAGKTTIPMAECAHLRIISVLSAQEMYEVVMMHIKDKDIFVGAAAVSDYRVAHYQKDKIKKQDDTLTLTLIKNKDIIQKVALLQQCFVVGFAAETDNASDNARRKLAAKGLQMLLLNTVDKENGFPFGAEKNALSVFVQGQEEVISLALEDKQRLAEQIAPLLLGAYKKYLELRK